MKRSFAYIVGFGLIMSLLTIVPKAALTSEDAKNCHCFRNRTFNPQDKFISDDYILTTTFNSLLASEFNIPKRQIIMMKMRDGVANNDLLTALYISREGGLEVSKLIDMRKKTPWQKIINSLLTTSTPPETKKLFQFITTSTSDDQITEQITLRLINSRFSPPPEALDLLGKKGLTSREIILSFTLADHSKIDVEKITGQYLEQGHSWSEIAHNLGLNPSDTGKLLEKPKPEK